MGVSLGRLDFKGLSDNEFSEYENVTLVYFFDNVRAMENQLRLKESEN